MITDSSDSIRQHALECAKNFKTGWVELGRVLYTIWKEKSYRNWGYSTFEGYVSKEINIRKLTALKLLRSYYFLQKEEPGYLKEEYMETTNAASVPNYESIDVLRLAKNKKELNQRDYENLKRNVFLKGGDVRDIKKDLTTLIRERQELTPEEAWEEKRSAHLKRLLTTLKSLKKELESAKLLSQSTLKELSGIIRKIEGELDTSVQ